MSGRKAGGEGCKFTGRLAKAFGRGGGLGISTEGETPPQTEDLQYRKNSRKLQGNSLFLQYRRESGRRTENDSTTKKKNLRKLLKELKFIRSAG